jgi:DNA polymerase III gamma/tau subunit
MYYFIQRYKNKTDSIGINNELETSFDISGFLSEKSVYKITEAISISEMLNIVNEIGDEDIEKKILEIAHILESGENNKLLVARCLIYLFKGGVQNIEELNKILKMIDIEELKEFYKNIGIIYGRFENEIKKFLLEMLFNVNKLLFNEILLKNIKYDELVTNYAIKNINNNLENIFGREQQI